jgi:hypothetical protein
VYIAKCSFVPCLTSFCMVKDVAAGAASVLFETAVERERVAAALAVAPAVPAEAVAPAFRLRLDP